MLVVSLVLMAVGAWFVPTPYVSMAPGSLRDTEGSVTVSGEWATSSDGQIYFTTVSIGDANVYDIIRSWIDPGVALQSKETFYGERDPDERRQANVELMDRSKEQAVVEAFQYLGIEVPEIGTGALIERVESGSPADGNVLPGDTIVAVGGEAVGVAADAVDLISGHRPGDRVSITVDPANGGEHEVLEITLSARPDDASAAFLGVALATRDQVLDLPVDLEIDSGTVSGPSAGLAFTLAVLDLLSPTDLTGGHRLAVTGVINDDGSVGAIGGLVQKAAAVERAGVDTFIVPAAQSDHDLRAARELVGDDVEIVAVANLDDAVLHLVPSGIEVPTLASLTG